MKIDRNTRRFVTADRRHFARHTDPLLLARRSRHARALALKAERSGAPVKVDSLAWANIPARICLGEGAEWTDSKGNAWKLKVESEDSDTLIGDFEPHYSSLALKCHTRRNTGSRDPWVFDRKEQFGAFVDRGEYKAIEVPSTLADPRPDPLKSAVRKRLTGWAVRAGYVSADALMQSREEIRKAAEDWRTVRATRHCNNLQDGTPRHEAWESDKARALIEAEEMERRQRIHNAPWGWWASVEVVGPDGEEIASDTIGGLLALDDAGWRDLLIETVIGEAAWTVERHTPTREIRLTAKEIADLREGLAESIYLESGRAEVADSPDPATANRLKALAGRLDALAATFGGKEG